LDFDTLYAFQLLDEFLLNREDICREHCSTIGLNKIGRQPAYLAQNWDIGAHMHGFQTILHVRNESSDIESFVFSYAGFIAAFGMNNKGVGICVNSMPELNYAREGLPVAFVVRGVLEQSSQQEAVEFLHGIKHASPQNYLIGGPEKIVDLECSANRITPFVNCEGSEVVYHTNHALINDDYNIKYLRFLQENDEDALKGDNSHTRFDALEKRLNVASEDITFDTIKAALSSRDSEEHPVCMHYREGAPLFNLGSTVMVLSEDPEFHIAFGPPDVTAYTIHKF
jgi:predicted choloylglycine hydrolase